MVVLILLLALQVQVLRGQEESSEREKKNPEMRAADISTPQQDTIRTPLKTPQRPLPKFDLPEFVITGTASIDLPKLEKIMMIDSAVMPAPVSISSEKYHRDRETLELEMKRGERDSLAEAMYYSGYVKAGIGTYFTPQAELQFGQSFPEYYYSIGGKYFLTKGYAPNTDRSSGGLTASGGTTLISGIPMLQHADVQAGVGYRSESFRFYGSAIPDLQRTLSDFHIQAEVENQAVSYFPYAAGISLESVAVSDSSSSKTETRFDVRYQTSFPIASVPVLTAVHVLTATGGLGFMDLSAAAQHSWFSDFQVEGSLHLSWAKGMEGQNSLRLCPRVLGSYQVTTQHRVFLSYDQMFIPMTLATSLVSNRYLSAASVVRHEFVSGEGAIGVESMWTEAVTSRIFLQVKSARDLPLFSDSSAQGIWMLAYGGNARIVTFCAEMVAKLNSNDYFASNILLRSTKDSFLGGKIPYTPAIEAWCSAIHNFGSTVSMCAEIRFAGERTTDLAGTAVLSKYAVVDVSGDYTPWEYIKLFAGIKNLTDTKFETWRGYREFPFTMQLGAQIKW
jgi:hypothetical protein